MKLFFANGRPVAQDLTPFGPAPEGAIALKFADEVDDARWITDADELRRLESEDAPLAYIDEPEGR